MTNVKSADTNLKYCKYCDTTQPRMDFPKKGAKCKKCVSICQKQYRETHKDEIAAYQKQYNEDHKEEIVKNQKQYYENHREKLIEYANQYNKDHREEKVEYQKQYQEENKDKIAEKRNIYQRERRNSDPSFKLRTDMSTLVGRMLVQTGSSKNGSSCMDYILWTIDEFWADFEKKFALPENLTPDGKIWMTRYNRGKYIKKDWKDNDPSTWTWQIDHVIPQADLPSSSMKDENFKKCWDLKNLRPLSAKQNQHDGATKIRHLKKSS